MGRKATEKSQQKKPKRSNKNICQWKHLLFYCKMNNRWRFTVYLKSLSEPQSESVPDKSSSKIPEAHFKHPTMSAKRTCFKQANSRSIGGSVERPNQVKLALPVPQGKFQRLWRCHSLRVCLILQYRWSWQEYVGSRNLRFEFIKRLNAKWRTNKMTKQLHRVQKAEQPAACWSEYLCLFVFMRQLVSF